MLFRPLGCRSIFDAPAQVLPLSVRHLRCISSLGFVILAAVLFVMLVAGTTARAAISHGDFTGDNFQFLDVTETDTQLPGPTVPPFYGLPAVAGDTLMFTPPNFVAAVSGGEIELLDGLLTMGIKALNSGGIAGLSIIEGGGWAVGGGTSATIASASLIVNDLLITEVNGIGINPIEVVPTIQFSYTGTAPVVITAQSITFQGDGGMHSGAWDAVASFNFAAALAANNITGTVTAITLALNNQLAGQSQTSSLAYIDKKNFRIGPAIPEPAVCGLAMMAVAALVTRRRVR